VCLCGNHVLRVHCRNIIQEEALDKFVEHEVLEGNNQVSSVGYVVVESALVFKTTIGDAMISRCPFIFSA
jgi:D-mannonate dehydratase